MPSSFPSGVQFHVIIPHVDERGDFSEIFREEWWPKECEMPVQWNLVRSKPETLRGIHVHRNHVDFLVVISGRMELALLDLRPNSDSFGLSVCCSLDGSEPTMVMIPTGVAHGFYFPEASTHIYGVSRYWDIADELGCHYADSDLQLSWPISDSPKLSQRDSSLGTFADLRREVCAWKEHLPDT